MRITYANIPAQAYKSSTQPPAAANKAPQRHLSNDARDSYRKNSGPQIIDAEFVEFYSPSRNHLAQERLNLDNTLEPDNGSFTDATDATDNETSDLGRYQTKSHEAPPPGSLIDILA